MNGCLQLGGFFAGGRPTGGTLANHSEKWARATVTAASCLMGKTRGLTDDETAPLACLSQGSLVLTGQEQALGCGPVTSSHGHEPTL